MSYRAQPERLGSGLRCDTADHSPLSLEWGFLLEDPSGNPVELFEPKG